MILNDKQIIKLAEEHEMISPFVNKSVANGISHGVNPFGYDLRCGSEFKIFTNIKGATACLLYTSPSPRDSDTSRMPSCA